MKYALSLLLAACMVSASAHSIQVVNKENVVAPLKGFSDMITVKFCSKNIFKPCHNTLKLNVPTVPSDALASVPSPASPKVMHDHFESVQGQISSSANSSDIIVISAKGFNRVWSDEQYCTKADKLTIDQFDIRHSTCDGVRPHWHFRALCPMSEVYPETDQDALLAAVS